MNHLCNTYGQWLLSWRGLMVGLWGSILFLHSCSCSEQHPGYEFMPDMAHTKAYKTYSENTLAQDSMSAMKPPEGAIPRDYEPYRYPNTKKGYEQAGKELTNPIPQTDSVLKEGKRLFDIYCKVCHGPTGKGDGPITMTKDGPFPPPPSFQSNLLNKLPEGKIFHSITYGKLNTQMPSYSAQLNYEERWKVTHYVQKLQMKGRASADTATTAKTDTTQS